MRHLTFYAISPTVSRRFDTIMTFILSFIKSEFVSIVTEDCQLPETKTTLSIGANRNYFTFLPTQYLGTHSEHNTS